jgi:hypothetical protein
MTPCKTCMMQRRTGERGERHAGGAVHDAGDEQLALVEIDAEGRDGDGIRHEVLCAWRQAALRRAHQQRQAARLLDEGGQLVRV